MTRAYYANGSQDKAIVTDIGEGKILETRDIETSAGASYGCSEFRAPEVHGVQEWSPAADVFSFGVLCCKVLDLWAEVCRTPIPDKLRQLVPCSHGETLVPKEITKVVEGCLSRVPAERPSIRSVTMDLDRLFTNFYSESEDNSPLRGEPEGLQEQIEWSRFTWRKALAIAQGAMDAGVPGQYSTRESILGDK